MSPGSRSWKKIATKTVSIKRSPSLVDGKRGAKVAVDGLTDLRCTPLTPTDPEIRARLGLERSPHEILQISIHGNYDIREGDDLTIDGKDYPIRAIADYTWYDGVETKRLIVEDLKSRAAS